MGNSWGHALQRISDEQRAELAHEPGCPCGCRHYKSCTMGRMDHLEPAAFRLTYSYVTGRAGRVSFATKNVCEDHAAKAAKKYGIDLAAVQEDAKVAGPGGISANRPTTGTDRPKHNQPTPPVH